MNTMLPGDDYLCQKLELDPITRYEFENKAWFCWSWLITENDWNEYTFEMFYRFYKKRMLSDKTIILKMHEFDQFTLQSERRVVQAMIGEWDILEEFVDAWNIHQCALFDFLGQ